MPGISYAGSSQNLSENEKVIKKSIQKHIDILAGQIGERNIFNFKKLCASAEYIEHSFLELGYDVLEQSYTVYGNKVKNIEVELQSNSNSKEIILLGAHYDSVFGSPGANDNASGIAALLELSRLIYGHNCDRTLKLVAFVNEEPPFFQSNNMGSYLYAQRSRERMEKIKTMISIETIGYYTNKKNSQNYPFPLGRFYPKTGNFIGFVANLNSKHSLYNAIDSFRKNTKFPSQGVAAAKWLPGISSSDQWAFWKMKYPAIMITDTAPYRYPYYHTKADTPEKIDYDAMARVVGGISRMVLDLLNLPPNK